MLNSPPEMLDTIISYSKEHKVKLQVNKKSRFDFRYWNPNDDMPFSEIVPEIAESINAIPRGKPKLKVCNIEDDRK